MSIRALPGSTTRCLGAGQALPSPAALIKELLDNATDARATSIEILLSANTLDKIEVRDNGSGIAADDLEQVGKRGHTSKLTCFEELGAVGRTSLGFRGEALASACTMGEVAITTRTKGDRVATFVKLKPTGGVDISSSKSHPIGTTISVSNLFSKFPVRKQNFLKHTSKTVSEIKDLLQSYALARLHIRLSLKVTKSPKSNWIYVTRAQDGQKEAAAKVVGKDVAALCKEETHNLSDHNITITVLLPRAESDLTKVKGGCHVSVDGRPLSSSRQSLASKIYTAYKQALKELTGKTGQELCKDPFFYLRMSCHGDIYDPNVEPAKDDIIFESADRLVSSLEEFFRSLYPPPAVVLQEQFPPLEAPTERPNSVLESDYDALLSQQLSTETHELVRTLPSVSENGQDVEDKQPHGQLSRPRSSTLFIPPLASPEGTNSVYSVLNPWSISNRTAIVPQPAMQPPVQLTSDTYLHNKPLQNALHTPPASHGKFINRLLPHALYNPSPFSALPSKPPPGQRTIESWFTHSDDDSYLDQPPRPRTAMTIFDNDAPFGHSHTMPRRQSSYRDEPNIIDTEIPQRKKQKVGPAFVKAGSISMVMNATLPPSSQTGGLKAVKAFSQPSLGVTVRDASNDDLQTMSMDDEPHILGHPILPTQRKRPFKPEDGSFQSSLQSRCKGGGDYRAQVRGEFTNKPFQSHRRKSVSKSNTGSQRHLPRSGSPMTSLDDDEPAQALLPEDDDPIGHGTSEQALDFEHRKLQATKRLRAENALQELDRNNVMRTANLERGNRMLGQVADIAHEEQISTGSLGIYLNGSDTAFTEATSRPGTTLPADDPRAYLMKRRNMSRPGHKTRRFKTTLLPLETVQPSEELQGFVLTTGYADVNKLADEREKMESWDDYVLNGVYKDGLEMNDEEAKEVEESFKAVMERFQAAQTGSQGSQSLW